MPEAFKPTTIDDALSQPTANVLDVLKRNKGPYLILGAGGKMGLHLCRMLRIGLDRLKREDSVIAVSRFSSLRDRDSFERAGISTILCDLTNESEVKELPDAPVVFYLAGIKFGTAHAPELLHKFNVEMPRIAAKRYRNSRIVAFSTGCVYPFVTPESAGATETTEPAPFGDYAISCLGREKAFAEISEKFKTPVSLIRLNYSVETRYGILVDIGRKILSGEPIDVTTGFVNLIWQRDAIAHTIQALEIAGSPAAPINITGPEVLSVRELATKLGQSLDRKVSFIGNESATAWLSNPAKSQKLFGPPETSIDEMISKVAGWLKQDGEIWNKPTGFEKRDGQF